MEQQFRHGLGERAGGADDRRIFHRFGRHDHRKCRYVPLIPITLYIAILLLLGGCRYDSDETISIDPADAPYSFAEVERESSRGAYAYEDLDGDGIDEYLTFREGGTHNCNIVATRYNGTVIDQINLPPAEQIHFEFAADANNDGDRDLFILTHERDTVVLSIVDVYHSRHSSFLFRFPLSLSRDTITRVREDEGFDLVGLVDDKAGSRSLILGTFFSYLSRGPRAVVAFDYREAMLSWQYRIGPAPGLPLIHHVRADNQACLIVPTKAPGNGVAANGTDDFHTVLFAFASDGTPLWRPIPLGGVFSGSLAYIRDIDRDGVDELVCFFSSQSKIVEKSYVKIFSLPPGIEVETTRELVERLILPSSNPLVDFEGKTHIVLCSFAGTISIVDAHLEPERRVKLPVEATAYHVVDMDADGVGEIAVQLKTGITLILDHRLQVFAVIDRPVKITTTRFNPKSEHLLVLAGDGTRMVGRLERNSPVYNSWIILGTAILIVGSIGVGGYRILFYYLIVRRLSETSPGMAFVIITRTGSIMRANKSFHSIFHLSAESCVGRLWSDCLRDSHYHPLVDSMTSAIAGGVFTEKRVDLTAVGVDTIFFIRTHPVFLAKRWRMGTLIGIYDITMNVKSERMAIWASLAQHLAHEMKTPLSTMWFTIERIRQEHEATPEQYPAEHLDSMEEEIRRLDRYVKGFMKLADLNPPNIQENDIRIFLEEFVEVYRKKLPSTVHFIAEYDTDVPAVRIDVHLFTVVMTNLLDNAVTAMRGRGKLKTSAYLAYELNRPTVCIAVSDTGIGIDESDQTKIFDPYFTRSRGGTGLGLVITKKIVESHGGFITFVSKKGLGSEFVIHLPTSTAKPVKFSENGGVLRA